MSIQTYKKYKLRYIDQDYTDKKARQFDVVSHDTKIWIPLSCLNSDMTLKEGRNHDFVFRDVKLPPNYLTETRKIHTCKGCGRIIPKGSFVYRRIILSEGDKQYCHWCNECWAILQSCMEYHKIGFQTEQDVRKYCMQCSDHPFCDKARFLVESNPGDTSWSDWKSNV